MSFRAIFLAVSLALTAGGAVAQTPYERATQLILGARMAMPKLDCKPPDPRGQRECEARASFYAITYGGTDPQRGIGLQWASARPLRSVWIGRAPRQSPARPASGWPISRSAC
jgi:hypothetical protein